MSAPRRLQHLLRLAPDRAYLLVPAQAYVGKFLATFKDYPPRQKAASFSLKRSWRN